MKQSWSIVVFCYNEVGTIRDLIERIVVMFDAHLPHLYEVVVVDDGSTDGSLEEIQSALNARPDVVKLVLHEKNKGIGETLRDGYMACKNENITAVPADGQFDIQELLPHLIVPAHSFVSFYRRENVTYTAFRTILSAVNKYINSILNGIRLRDVNWVKIYKREVITSFPWHMHSSLIESELCAKLLIRGDRAIEVKSIYHPRVSGKSKGASLRVVMQALLETAKLVWSVQLFRWRHK